jgi:hypothetical protein
MTIAEQPGSFSQGDVNYGGTIVGNANGETTESPLKQMTNVIYSMEQPNDISFIPQDEMIYIITALIVGFVLIKRL